MLLVVQTVAVLAKMLGVLMAADKAQEMIRNALTGEDQQTYETFALMNQTLPLIEDFFGQLPIEDLTLLVVKPFILGGAYFVAKTIVQQNHRSDSLLYEMILRIKIHDDAIEKSSSVHKQDTVSIQEHLTVNPAFKVNGPLVDLEKVIGLIRRKLPFGLNYDKSNDGPVWKIIYRDNYPKLAIDVYENWFAIENLKSFSNLAASKALFLDQDE
uniref:Uncharacterized protein n=1 Tax=Romanomermis culicivorax TaxID=13658 RepID=A0A915IM92_ROMCU